MQKIPVRSGESLRSLLLVILTLGMVPGHAEAQNNSHAAGTPAESKAGVSTASTYARDNLETVNLANGNLSLNLPLVSIGGRGSAAYTLALSYNSKLWSAEHEFVDGDLDPLDSPMPDYHRFYAYYDQASVSRPNVITLGGGWSLSAGPALRTQLLAIDPHPCTGGPFFDDVCYKYALTRVWLLLPDGSEIELRDQSTDGAPFLKSISPSLPDRDRGRVWRSTDGSATTFISDAANGLVTGQLSGWVFLADGTRLRMEGDQTGGTARCTRIIDRHGNFVTIDWAAPAGLTYTDQLGRQVVVADSGTVTTITVKGYLGSPDRVVSIDTGMIAAANASGVLDNLRADFRHLPRPFTSGDYQRTAQGDFEHTILTSHTDLFPGSEGAEDIGSKYALTRVTLPDGRSMRFRYNQYGELAEVVYPGGGLSQIDYQGFQTTICETVTPFRETFDRRVVGRRTLTDGVNVDATWVYGYGSAAQGFEDPVATVEAREGAAGALLLSEKHFFLAVKAEYRTCVPNPNIRSNGTGYEKWENAKEFRVERQTGAGTQVTVRGWEQRAPVVWGADPGLSYNSYVAEHGQQQPPNDPRVAWEETTLENGLKSRVEYGYDQFNNVTLLKEYDYGAGGAFGPLLRQTLREYVGGGSSPAVNGHCYTNLNPSDPACGAALAADLTTIIHQRRLPLSESVLDAAGATQAFTQYEYDKYLADGSRAALTVNAGMIGYDGGRFAPFGADTQPRGNVTRVARWLGGSDYIYAYNRYDNAGNVVSVKDPRGHVSTLSFADDFGDGTNPSSGGAGPQGATFAFPTLVTNALGHQLWTQYSYTYGAATGVRDANGAVTRTEFDETGRPVRVTAGHGLAEQSVSETAYPTAAENVSYESRRLDAARWLSSRTEYDGFDRPVLTSSAEDGRHFETAVYTLHVRAIHDPLGRPVQASNPYRAGQTPVYTTTTYDLAGRVTELETPDGAKILTTHAGNTVTVTDQAGRKRRSLTDALGRLVRVDEPDKATGALDTAGGAPVQPTHYAYDALSNLRKVDQGGQLRFFAYDPLQRLVRIRNHEQGVMATDADFPALTDASSGVSNSQWSVGYKYDAVGNLIKRRDARGITTTYGYDALNRNTSVDYSDATPDVTRAYDGAVRGKGRAWKAEAAGVSRTTVPEYDALGRPRSHQQQFWVGGGWGAAFTASRLYDLAGNVTSQTYPSGRAVAYAYDAAGRLSSFSGDLGDGAQRVYSTGITYDELGGMRQERFGTDTPLYHKRSYNTRGQLTQIRVGTFSADEGWWNRGKIVNHYTNQAGADGPDNNGNLLSQDIYVPSDDQISGHWRATQRYEYDALNRLTRVVEAEGGADRWAQVFDYDRWGNRTVNTDATQVYGQSPSYSIPEPGFDKRDLQHTNHLHAPGDLDPGTVEAQRKMRYDGAGNLVQELCHNNLTLCARAYDAEGRLVSAQFLSGQVQTATFKYDADGRRVMRDGGWEGQVRQVYGFEGELLAEYSPQATASSPRKEYGYRAGQLLVTAESPDAAGRVNFALSASGATATASSTLDAQRPPSGAIDGDRAGHNWGAGGGWHDATQNAYTDWLEVDFGAPKTVDEVDVFSVQDTYWSPQEPSGASAFTQYGLVDFDVQRWDGSAWVTVPGGEVRGNGLVWRKLTFAPVTTQKIRVLVRAAQAGYSRVAELEAWGPAGPPPPRLNVASTTAGATATASSTLDAGRAAAGALNGDRAGRNWGNGGGWHDATNNVYPDWLEVSFGAARTIDEVSVFSVQDNFLSPSEPTEQMTFSLYGLTSFDVQWWDGAAWQTAASVTNNHLVWRKVTFAPVTTTKFRVLITGALAGYGRVAEVEAYGGAAQADLRWLVTDHLGTPRMVFDRTGSLAAPDGRSGVRRHDYLPFGEEIRAGVGGRTTGQGYWQSDGPRQKFTGYERDSETGLDYAQARYYSSAQGRFTSVDPLLASATPLDPQTWNRYAYVLNRPTVAVDPNGLSTIIVVISSGRDRRGRGPVAYVLVLNRRGERVAVGRHGTDHIPGLARGSHADRTRENGDTPFGAYRIFRDPRSDLVAGERGERGERTGTQGGAADSNPRGASYGTGIIYLEPVGGEVADNGRSMIYFHGGGQGDSAFDPNQPLTGTFGCVRLSNQDVNALIQAVNDLDSNGDPVTGIYMGDAPSLNNLAGERGENGQHLYPDLRTALGLDQPSPQPPQQQRREPQ